MTCHILGLGPSIVNYRPDGDFSIGCNDSFRYSPSNILIVVSNLSQERTRIVEQSRPEKLLSFMPEWSHHPNYEYIGQLHRWRTDRPERNRLDKGKVYHSNNTPFISCSVAFNLGYKEIVMWGVDFIDHPNIKGTSLETAKKDFNSMHEGFKENGVSLYLGSEGSTLNIPIWK
jgi:hypothetical protein